MEKSTDLLQNILLEVLNDIDILEDWKDVKELKYLSKQIRLKYYNSVE